MHLPNLPEHLHERICVISDKPINTDGEFVLYWMHHAVRGHENPALDVAISLGHEWGKPVVVYQGLGGAHRFNNDRHHTFIMQGARDVQAELHDRGVTYAFHLSRDPHSPGTLKDLANRAAIVIAEDFPGPPFPSWIQKLASKIDPPLWAVDCCCLIPMQSLGKSYDRAFQISKQNLE